MKIGRATRASHNSKFEESTEVLSKVFQIKIGTSAKKMQYTYAIIKVIIDKLEEVSSHC